MIEYGGTLKGWKGKFLRMPNLELLKINWKRTFKVPVYQIEPRYQIYDFLPVAPIRFTTTDKLMSHKLWLIWSQPKVEKWIQSLVI